MYHAEEHIAFWILANTFERFEMRDIYLPSKTRLALYPFFKRVVLQNKDLPGLKKHSYIFE